MAKILYTAIFILINISLYSQSAEKIVPFYNNGKWGFMNKNKDIIVCPKYEEAYPSTSDRYRVKANGKYGFIDDSGKMVIKAKYDEAEDFRYGLAKVNRKGKVVYIKRNGKRNDQNIALCGNHSSCSIPRLNDKILIFEKEGKFGVEVNQSQNENIDDEPFELDSIHPVFDTIVPISYRLMYLKKDSLYAFLRVSNYWGGSDEVTKNLKFEFEDIKLYDCDFCNEGLNKFIGIKKNGFWGYKKLYFAPEDYIEPKYLSISSLADGFAKVEYELDKFGYIDYQGNEYFIR